MTVPIRFLTGMVLLTFATGAFAQETTDEDAVELDRIEVTGTRIKRVDVEGTTPITIITRDMIEAAGDSTIAELLRTSTYNSFGSKRDRSSVSHLDAMAFINLRGLGPKRTLVLLNGRRMSKAPRTGADSVDINMIPMDMVERVEILRDGASAIYGSDAIAGVINIITRKEASGVTLTIQAEDPDPAGGEAERYSVAGGMGGDSGNVTFALEHFRRAPIFQRDIPRLSDITAFGNVTSYGFPASGLVVTGPLAGSPGLTFPDPRCPESVGDSDLFPNAFRWDPFNGPGTDWKFTSFCGYNFAADIIWIPRAERTSAWLDARYDVSDNTRFLARALLAQNEGESRFAGAPVIFPFPVYGADNPNNPMRLFIGRTITDPGLAVLGVPEGTGTFTEDLIGDVRALLRTVPSGTRDGFQFNDSTSLFTGFEGENDWFGGAEWDLGFEYSRNRNQGSYKNLSNSVELQNAIDLGELDLFNVQGLDHDEWLSGTVETMRRFNHTGTYYGGTDVISLDATLGFDLFQMRNGPVPVVLGFEFFDMEFDQEYDPESNRGIIAGGPRGDIVKDHGRDVLTFFAETLMPLGQSIELNLAARHDDYSDFGGTTNPKVSMAWRPSDDWLFRVSYGEGFRAPNMLDLWVPESDRFSVVFDSLGCENGIAPCEVPIEVLVKARRNLNLQPEESESWTAGVVWNATDSLGLELTWFDIKYTGHIDWGSAFDMLWLEKQGLTNTVARNPDGTINHIVETMWNLSGLRTSGLDFTAHYALDTERAGRFNFKLELTHILDWEEEYIQGEGYNDWLDFLGLPEDRGSLGLNWTRGNFQAGWVTHYIGRNGAAQNLCWPSGSDGPCSDGDELMVNEAGWVHDLQLAWNASWDGQVAIGARNLFNDDPPLLPCCMWPATADLDDGEQDLYDLQGRIVYLRYKQNF